MRYIHQIPGWPNLRWSAEAIADRLAGVRHRQGRLIGRMEGLGFDLQAEAVLQVLTEDVVTSSAIEGEVLSRAAVRSSLARRLGVEIGGLTPADRHVEGVVELMLDATQNHRAPLGAERLFGWHGALFPTGRSGLQRIVVADWRHASSGPMQVVSGGYGREKVHFEAPPAERLAEEMAAFLRWFETPSDTDPVLRAGIAHLWFVTIHPFEDGNGRIARAIADLALARAEESPRRFYSLSAQISRERSAYYEALERAQKGGLDITDWLLWFLDCLDRAILGAEQVSGQVMAKSRLWASLAAHPLNDRQRLVINKLIDGFEGNLTSGKWAKLTKVSSDTALRDIHDLLTRGLLERAAAGGRSTSYRLVTPPPDGPPPAP